MTGRVSLPHVGALDGLRGVAVAGVLLYHGSHLTGGYLGVDLFFVLSGYLITSLLLAEWRTTTRISLGAFWARRARRLLPALALVLVGVALYCLIFANPAELSRIRGDALATIAYVANWRAIFAHQSYFDLFLAPSPLQHTWSLAIEEQFYVFWPLIFVAIAATAKRRTPHAVLGVAVLFGAASTGLMFGLYDRANTNRAYYGTDTRAFALFAGIAIAAAVAIWGYPKDRLQRALIEISGLASLAVLAVMWTTLDGQAPRLYRGGFTVAGIAAALLIAAAAHPTRGPINRVLSLTPLRGLGLISYGLYLWHWPIDLVVTAKRTDLTGWPLFALQTALALAVAIASYYLLEMPIRRGALRPTQWRIAIPAIAIIVAIATVISTTTSTTNPALASPRKQLWAAPDNDVLVMGDSLAASLGPGLDDLNVKVGLASSPGCRLIHGELIIAGRFSTNCSWESGWKFVVDRTHPRRVVLLAGVWDLFDVKPTGSTAFVGPGSPEWDSAFEMQVDRLVSITGARGASIALLTLPCTHPLDGAPKQFGPGGERIDRVNAANAVIRRVASRHPENVTLVDLFGFLCPAGKYQSTVRGVRTRSDGVHLSRAGADLVARWLLPQIGLKPRAKPQPSTSAVPNAQAATIAGLTLQNLRLNQLVDLDRPRILVAGDSMAYSLVVGANQSRRAPLGVLSVATIGCGIGPGTPIGPKSMASPSTCKQWPGIWQQAIALVHPRAVILLNGIWDIWPRNANGRTLAMYSKDLKQAMLEQLERARSITARAGIPLVLLTVPCLSPTPTEVQLVGKGLDEPRRTRWLNGVYEDFARARRDVVVIDFGRRVCDLHPSPLSDGVHLSPSAAVTTWDWLSPQVLNLLPERESAP